uniref:Putative secreted protein n=1 Tax=Xenopsylla cheopis TaxID=163159 RepID=A0A6M2DZG8_XENCH
MIQNVFYFVIDLFHFAFFATRLSGLLRYPLVQLSNGHLHNSRSLHSLPFCSASFTATPFSARPLPSLPE